MPRNAVRKNHRHKNVTTIFFTAKSIGDLLALTPKDSKIFQVSGDRMALAVSMALPTLVFTETRRMPKWMDTGGKCGKWKHVETRWMDDGLKKHAKTRGRELQLPLLFRLYKTRHRCGKKTFKKKRLAIGAAWAFYASSWHLYNPLISSSVKDNTA